MNNIDNSVVNKESAMSIAFVIFAILAIITAVWKGSVMNKFVANKESVMLVVSKRSIGLAFSIVCTAALFIPYALVATFQDMVVCTLALAPLAFTAIDILIHVEYHDEVRSIALAYNALKGLPAYEAKVKANYAEMMAKIATFLLLVITTACSTDAKPEMDNAQSTANAVTDYKQVDNTPKAYGQIETPVYKDGEVLYGTCSAWKWNGKVYTIQHCNEYLEEHGNTDRVQQSTADNTISGDFYKEGTECSPDIRWWGTTTNKWVTIPMEQIFKKTRNYLDAPYEMQQELIDSKYKAITALNDYKYAIEENSMKTDSDNAKKAKEKARAAFNKFYNQLKYIKEHYTSQEYLCASSVAEDSIKKGDSGGPIMLGDEVIGSASFFVRTDNQMFDEFYTEAHSNYPVSCFAMVDNKPVASPFIDGMASSYSDIFSDYTNVFDIIEVLGWTHE
jgi:hypothetical protein